MSQTPNIANSVMIQSPDYSKHDLSSSTKTTTVLGRLTPIFLREVVPGDHVNINAEVLTKLMPLATPCFQNMNATVHYFYVPYRIMWKNWKYFHSETNAPGDVTPPLHPYFKLDSGNTGMDWLAQYFGLDYGIDEISLFPFITYQLIWNEYYRHEKIHHDISENLTVTDGFNYDNPDWHILRNRTYKDDYFTAALPSPQAGNEAYLALQSATDLHVLRNTATPSGQNSHTELFGQEEGVPSNLRRGVVTNYTAEGTFNDKDLFVNVEEAQLQIAMNDLIELTRMQEFLVRNNIAGNRYNEFVKAHYGVTIPDLRIDRPDYIGGVKSKIMVSELLNTGNIDDQGYQTGQAAGYSEGGDIRYKVLEHGLVMGIYSAYPDALYTESVQRLFFKRDAKEYYIPVFDQMGERPIQNKEVRLNHTDPEGTFGYVPQYAEYRLPFNMVTGLFKTDGYLQKFYLGIRAGVDAVLNEEWFDINNPDEIFKVVGADVHNTLVHVFTHCWISRPMKKYSMPTLTNTYGNNII